MAMVDWTKSMQQTYEYYIVDPGTWGDAKKIDNIKSSRINRDEDSDTLGSASFDLGDSVGEVYIRVYLITIQNGVKERHDLGTFLVETTLPQTDGKTQTVSADGYTPLLELNENPLPIGYYIPKGTNIMEAAYILARENMRAPVVKTTSSEVLHNNFVAKENDTYLTFIRDLVGNANYTIGLDEKGRMIFVPKQEFAALQPVYTFNDDNSSILQPSVSVDEDIFGIPNVVNVICSNGKEYFDVTVENDDSDSLTSIKKRGRRIIHRVVNPDLLGDPTLERVQEYAEKLLKTLSSVERTITYTHGYCGNRVGDCVRLNYAKAGLNNVKAKVISQSIDCKPGCQVSETAVYTTKYWR